jgi:hypothetical protein
MDAVNKQACTTDVTAKQTTDVENLTQHLEQPVAGEGKLMSISVGNG